MNQEIPSGRVDERDTMFARMAREPGARHYEEYYSRNGHRRSIDDHLRSLPGLMQPGGRFYDETLCGEAARLFAAIDTLHVDAVLVDTWTRRLKNASTGKRATGSKPGAGSPDPMTRALVEMARQLGAVAAGCAPVDPAFVYTCKGRFASDYGAEVPLDCPSAVVFLVEMDFDEMKMAPAAPAIRESAHQYLRAARIAKTMAAALSGGGWRARPQYDAHYDVMLPPLAVLAGLGELGRNNLLVADRYGARVRIGAVTTDCPLEHGRPISLGVRRFCETCRTCAACCPSKALETGPPAIVRGIEKWGTNVERCYAYWRTAGTDCGLCMALCPFSHRDTGFHNFVRGLVRRFPAIDPAARFFDDLIYRPRARSSRRR
jgi:reductive dehalogenase